MTKKVFISIISVLLCLVSLGQRDTLVNGKSYNYISYHVNDSIKELGNYKSSKKEKDGFWQVFDEKGELVEEGNYIKDKKSGHWKERGNSSSCCWSGIYIKGKKDGRWSDGFSQFQIYKKGKRVSNQTVHWN